MVLAIVFIVPSFAQSDRGIIYLKNGSILKGKFRYSEDFNKLQIFTSGNTWVFNATEVDSITDFRERRMQNIMLNKFNSSFYMRTEIGVLAGNSDNSQTVPFSFSSSLNYQIESRFSFGIGTGIEFIKESYLPLFVNVELKWRNAYSTPYFFLKSGYLFPLSDSNEIYYYDYQPWSSVWPYYNQSLDAIGGFVINPGVGYQWMYSSGFGMSFAFGYQFHRLKYKGEYDYGLDIDYNRLTIKFGIIFN